MSFRLPKTVRNTLISIFALLFLFTAAGVGYVYITGKKPPKNSSAAKAIAPAPQISLPKPKKPAANVAASASVESLVTPVAPGSNSSIRVSTVPSANCEISVTYNNVVSKDSGLAPKTADGYGKVVWSWKVDATAPAGRWPVKVTCKYGEKSAYVEGYLEITGS